MYHVELRQFPHNVCRFNLSGEELRAIVEPWARDQFIEFGERRWHPQQARLTILEGPRLPLGQLTMGRGWRAAEREGKDVTDRLLAAAGQGAAPVEGGAIASAPAGVPAPAGAAATAPDPAAGAISPSDPFALGVQIAALLGPDPIRLLDAWRRAGASSPGLSPSETLALAERSLAPRGATEG